MQSLFVTLRRSLANTREQHVRVVQSLGLWRREQTVEKPNNASVRGAIDKVMTASGEPEALLLSQSPRLLARAKGEQIKGLTRATQAMGWLHLVYLR